MKIPSARTPRRFMSHRYNVMLFIIYAMVLGVVMLTSPVSRYKRNLLFFFMIAMLILTMLRLCGVGKQLRFLDVILTCAFGMMLCGCRLQLYDLPGFFIVVTIGFLTMCVGGPWAWIAGGITLLPSALQIWEKWEPQQGYWFEIMLGFCMLMMLIAISLPNNDHCELMFLVFSFLSKAMLVTFVLT
jgi:hypothetical protein